MRINGICGMIKKRYPTPGKLLVILGDPITIGGIKWSAIVYKGMSVPTFIKRSAIAIITRKEFNSYSSSIPLNRSSHSTPSIIKPRNTPTHRR